MQGSILMRAAAAATALALATAALPAIAAPKITRLTPPSELFSSGKARPVIARFLPEQKFDLQATVVPDAGATITDNWDFYIDGKRVEQGVRGTQDADRIGNGAKVISIRGVEVSEAGLRILRVRARQSDGQLAIGRGNFEVVPVEIGGPQVKNVIIMLGDGMGASHRTAARIMLDGYAQGKARTDLAMDGFPYTAMVKTSSLDSIITDSSPGMASYVTGNKHANNQEGVFPDDTANPFDNPRTEYLAAYLARKYGKSLGIVTTADVFDATPAANAIYTSNRGAGTGIADQYLDDAEISGLTVLLGGGRKWFLPAGTPGSARTAGNDYVLPGEISAAWGAAPGKSDPERNLVGDFEAAGWTYVSDANELRTAVPRNGKLLGLFSFSNMNVALDKVNERRGVPDVVNAYGLPDQPLLDEMTAKAIRVLSRNPNGFVLMVEAASIDKQAHNMDTERWIFDTIEFDRAIRRAQGFAQRDGQTLVLITADHECAGATIIGSSKLSNTELEARSTSGGGAAALRNGVVGTYTDAGFPRYTRATDGYPVATDIDKRMLVGYGASADRYEDWLTNALPLTDSQQPGSLPVPPGGYPTGFPAGPTDRDVAGEFLITGEIGDAVAAHSAGDIPLSAYGMGSSMFGGTIDNSDVHFILGQAVVGGIRERSTGAAGLGLDAVARDGYDD